mgnify:CR=1 FL=1
MTSMPPICPVILAGGSGTRLWPLSRAGFPKQFLCLDGAHSLFQQTALRLAGLRSAGVVLQAPLVVGNEERDDAAVFDLGDGTAIISTTTTRSRPSFSSVSKA